MPKGFQRIIPLFIAVLGLSFSNSIAQDSTDNSADNRIRPAFLDVKTGWADSVFATLTPDERIGQLFMVSAYSQEHSRYCPNLAEHITLTEELVRDYKIGGLIFFKGSPTNQANLTNKYQAMSKAPLFIAIDGEWGLSMRLDSTVQYPRQMMLGAIQNEDLIYKMGSQIGEQCKRMGIHINFAPVIDVNNNAKNPVINNRSFGENKKIVARFGLAYMRGMQDHKVLACGKHFPGHGDTDKDSHKSLPLINHAYGRLDTLELYPFKELINSGLASIMVAHLYIPKLDNTYNRASTLSPKIVNGLLKDSLQFEGLVFTDALNMRGVTKYYSPGIVDVKAVLAGNDILLFPEDVPVAIEMIKKAIANGEITQKEIDERCLKILKAKEWAGLNKYQPIDTDELYWDLNTVEAEVLNREIANESMTLIQNQNKALPIQGIDTIKTVYINVGGTSNNEFYTTMNHYSRIPQIQISRALSQESEDSLYAQCEQYDRIIVGFHRMSNSVKKNYGITPQAVEIHNKLSQNYDVVTVLFGNPYVLESFGDVSKTKAILVGYEDTDYTNRAAAQVLFGGIKPKGQLPVTCTPKFPAGTSLTYDKTIRLKHVIPEEIGIQSEALQKIDDLCNSGVKNKAFPGCQVVGIKDGNVFYNKGFGYHTYDKQKEVNTTDLYDIASITKIAATTISLIRLQQEGKINIDHTLNDYLPELVGGTDYEDMVLRQMLAHQAGLHPWIPFYKNTLKDGKPDPAIYSTDSSAKFNERVAENLYISGDYDSLIFQRILSQSLREKTYKYSDLGYYFMKAIIEKTTGQGLDEYVHDTFYGPMGLGRITYLPLNKFSRNEITPTENDQIFRGQLIWGDVHDQGAAMQGGVGGHAGLFSNALDLATLMYMIANDGTYGGSNYLSAATIEDFTRCQYCPSNRRGAGFDKPVRSLNGGPTSEKVSLECFGHQGFTGTCTWADPDKDIVFVFLSNRVHPDAENWLILKHSYRTEIQTFIYEACGY